MKAPVMNLFSFSHFPIFLFFIVQNVFSQHKFPIGDYYSPNRPMQINSCGGYNINSNSLTISFYKDILRGEYLDSALKKNISARLKLENILGGDILFRTGISYMFHQSVNRTRWFYFADIADREHLDVRFSDDLLNFALYGNKIFAGKTASLGNFNLNLLRYQQLRAGIVGGDTSGNMLGFGISYLKGEQNLSIEAPRSEFYTSETGDLLALSAAINVSRTDTDNTGLNAFNGSGFSADFFARWTYDLFLGSKKRKGFVWFELSDLGLIRWNSKSLAYSQDTSYYYSGLYMDSIEEFNTIGTQFVQLFDSISGTIKYGWVKKSQTTHLPSWFILAVTQQHSNKLVFEAGGIYRYYANFHPYGYLKESLLINNYFTASLSAGYGGYGGFGVGAEGKLNGKGFQFVLGLTNIEGILNPQKTGGSGGYIGLKGWW